MNIQSLNKSNLLNHGKRSILMILIAILCIPTLVACTPTQSASPENEMTTPIDNTDISIIELDETGSSADTDVASNETEESNSLSKDAQELENMATHFLLAYFNGDIDTLKDYLISPYEWDIDAYSDPENTPDLSSVVFKGISDITEKNIDDVCVVYAQYKDNSSSDRFQNLTMEFIKKDDGWKIQFYGLE